MTGKKVVFAPGCFDQFDGTQKELDEFVAEIQKMVLSDDIFVDANPLSAQEEKELMSMLNSRKVQ
jgi:hypothetical protein